MADNGIRYIDTNAPGHTGIDTSGEAAGGRTLIGGTGYDVIGGRTLVGGTGYDVTGGRTLVGGTGYDVSFKPQVPIATVAMLYSDGSLVFQADATVASGKTLTAQYTGFEDSSTPKWNVKQNTFTSVSFDAIVSPTSMAHWFRAAYNMVANISKFSNLVIDNVTNMAYAYSECFNLTGSPVCGNNVTNMYLAYYECFNLTGSPVCGNNVTNMAYAYYECFNLTGSPVCGNNVTNMDSAYWNCQNLTGSPVCGNNVTNMVYAYRNCQNLTGSPVCGNNVTNMYQAYFNCRNLNAGNTYIYASNINVARNCFYGKNNSRRYNLYVRANSTTLNTFIIKNRHSLVGANITWTTSGNNYYNTAYNIYIYPVL